MLKIVVFDCGYGGEFFADQLEEVLPVVEVIRVINWREADKISSDFHAARKITAESLRPYIGKVDLIILANYYLSITSLNFFRQKFKNQLFLGLSLKPPDTFVKRDVLILSTKPMSKTIGFHLFVHRLKRNVRILNLDTWPLLIDDGELTMDAIKHTLEQFLLSQPNFSPEEIILASSQFNDIKNELKKIFGQNLKIYDGFDDTIRNACKTLKIRGGVGKKET